MNFQKNTLGLAVLAGTVALTGAAHAAQLDAPTQIGTVYAAARTVAQVPTSTVAGVTSFTAANARVNTLNTANTAAALDVKQLAALDVTIATATASLAAGTALTAGNLLAGATGTEIIAAARIVLGLHPTTGVYVATQSNNQVAARAVEAAAGIVTATTAATAQTSLNLLTPGTIPNSLVLGLQAAALETATGTNNGTVANGSGATTLGKLAYTASLIPGIATAGNQSNLYLAKTQADAAVVTAANLVTANGGAVVFTGGTGYIASGAAGTDQKNHYTFIATDLTGAGKIVEVRDQTKQIIWTVGSANSAAANTGTLAELLVAINANSMEFTAIAGAVAATDIILVHTDTRIGATNTVGVVKTAANLTAHTGGTTITITVGGVGANDGNNSFATVAATTTNLLTYSVNLANKTVLAATAASNLSVAVANAATTLGTWQAGETLEASYATAEALNLGAAGASMATINGVLNETVAVANAATAVLEGTAAAAELISSADLADVATATATLATATANTAAALTARDAAQAAFVASSTAANSSAYSAALTAYNLSNVAKSTATTALTAANNVMYGNGLTAATIVANGGTGTNATSITARAAVVVSQATATAATSFQDMQVQLSTTGNPAGALQASLIAGTDTGGGVVTAVNANYQAISGFGASIATNTTGVATNTSAIATNTSGVAANVATLAVHNGLVTTNIANIATNTTGIAANVATLAVHEGLVTTNIANIATNTGNIATNTAAIGGFSSGIAANTSALADISRRMSKDSDMLKSGIASALAIAGMPTAPGEGMGFSIGAGGFDGESAIAMGITFVSENKAFKLSVGNSGGETSASAGAAFKF